MYLLITSRDRTTYLQTLASLEEQHKLLLPSLKQCSNLKEIVTLWLEDANLQHGNVFVNYTLHDLIIIVVALYSAYVS